MHLDDVIKYKLKYRTAVKERDEARAQLANAAAREVDAVQGRQECERELREVKADLDAVRAALVSVLDEICTPDGDLWVEVETPMHHQKARKLTRLCKKARSILEDAA